MVFMSLVIDLIGQLTNYTHPDNHTRQTTDTPGFKPFTMIIIGLTWVIDHFPKKIAEGWAVI